MVDMFNPELDSGTEDVMVDIVSAELRSGTEVAEDAQVPAVSWAAIVAGGVASAALTLALLAFGAGIGLSAVSPGQIQDLLHNIQFRRRRISLHHRSDGVQHRRLSRGAFANQMGCVHTHEVYFRDTAHGFLAWHLPRSSAWRC